MLRETVSEAAWAWCHIRAERLETVTEIPRTRCNIRTQRLDVLAARSPRAVSVDWS